jgi:hypothetical protein
MFYSVEVMRSLADAAVATDARLQELRNDGG